MKIVQRKPWRPFAVGALALVAVLSHAQTPVTYSGAGANKCTQWISDATFAKATRNDTLTGQYVGWIQGFLSGASLYRAMPTTPDFMLPELSPPAPKEIELWIAIHCDEKPSRQISDVAMLILSDMVKRANSAAPSKSRNNN